MSFPRKRESTPPVAPSPVVPGFLLNARIQAPWYAMCPRHWTPAPGGTDARAGASLPVMRKANDPCETGEDGDVCGAEDLSQETRYWQSVGRCTDLVGMWSFLHRASRSISPLRASTGLLLTSIRTTVHLAYSTLTASKRQTSMHVPHPMHLSGTM